MRVCLILLVTSLSIPVEAFLPATLQTSQLATTWSKKSVRQYPASKLQSTLEIDDRTGTFTDQNKEEKSDFDWFKNWYPVVPVEFLDEEVPHRFQLLDMDLVIWKDAAVEGGSFKSKKERKKGAKRIGGEWRVFMDECPHRKVPLSEGRVEDDGSLLCSYHAFRFNGEGELIDVPQVPASEVDAIRQNPRSQCNSFPAQVINGVLWVWPETGSDARIESALKKPASYELPEDIDQSRVWTGAWNFRELPYSADYFIENVVDGAHVEVSHHNIVGSRYNVQKTKCTKQGKLTKEGFSTMTKRGEDSPGGICTFHAPVLVTQRANIDEDGAFQTLELYSSPSRPGFCNHVGRMVIVKPPSGEMPKLLRQFTLPLPTWLNHVMAALFLNQDGVFLHYQERNLAKKGSYISYKDGTSEQQDFVRQMLPVETDQGVINFRTWLRKFGGGFIPYKNGLELPPVDTDICFDQYKSHTSKCKVCQTALANLKKGRLAAFAVSVCLAVLRPAPKNIFNLFGVLTTAGIGLGINKLIGMFYRYEFSHGHND